MNARWIALLIAPLISIAYAEPMDFMGHETGNGGDVIVCKTLQGDIINAELLDFYEGRTLRGINKNLGIGTLSVEEKLEMALGRMTKESPKRVEKYRERYLKFYSDALFLPHVVLTDIPDSQHVAIPKGCQIEQIINQRDPEFDEDKRYTINKDLWDLLDNDNKAGLILHEIIYHEAIEHGATNSIASRYFNSVLTSDRSFFRNRMEFFGLMEKMKFLRSDYQGISLRLGKLDENGDFKTNYTQFSDGDNVRVGYLEEKDAFFWGKFHVIPRRDVTIQFDKLGNLATLDGFKSLESYTLVHVQDDNSGLSTKKLQITSAVFSPAREVESVRLNISQNFKVGDLNLVFKGYYDYNSPPTSDEMFTMTFYPGLVVESGILLAPTVLPYADGSNQLHSAGYVHFDMQGRVDEEAK